MFAQTDKPIHRHDSVSVSAGISKEQLALEDQLNAIVDKGNQPLLSERRNYVLTKLANGYVHGNRAKDAVPIYSQLLAERSKDCEPQSASISNCADAQFSLEMAKLNGGDFQGALTTLRDAETNYVRAEKVSESHEFSTIQLKDQAQTSIWIAVVLSQSGKTEEATGALEAAISQLTRVQADASIPVGIRDDAARSLRDAQVSLTRLKTQ